jgi:hypothetical protein
MPAAMWVSMLGMWGCRVVAGYTLGIVLGWGWSASGWGWCSTGPCGRAVLLAHGERALAVEISAEKCLTIAQSENNSANDRKLSGFDSVRRIVNIRPVHTIPL